MVLWLILLIVLAVIVLLIIFGYFNKFIILENRIQNSWAQIDVQLRKRADLVPNLIEAVKGYVKHEKEMIAKVTDARKALIGAIPSSDMAKKLKAGDVLQKALRSVFAIAEAYPQLRANENFIQLQQELSDIEDKVAYARQFYNDSVMDYNNTCRTVPGMWFAKWFGKKEGKYLEIPAAAREVPKVKF